MWVTAIAAVGAVVATTGGIIGYAESRATAADPPPSDPGAIVEDYSYPDAAKILQQQHVTLLSGDGHILLADCATPPTGDIGLINVWTTEPLNDAGRICFQVTASSGRLDLQVPGVYEIRGDGQRSGTGHHCTAEVTTDAGQHTLVTVDPSGSTQVGITTDPPGPPTTLLQLIVRP